MMRKIYHITKKVIRSIIIKYMRWLDSRYLYKNNPYQLERFNASASKVKMYYLPSNHNKFIHETWLQFSKLIEKEFIEKPRPDFFSCPTILKTMTGFTPFNNVNIILEMLELKYGIDKTKEILAEDLIGFPVLLRDCRYRTSMGRVIHAYQMLCIANVNELNLNDCFTITEWGGGYGGLARLITRTYINSKINIIDIPESIAIQYCYLTAINNDDCVQVHTGNDSLQKLNKQINLIPNSILESIDCSLIKCDGFISTWALSESNEFSIKFVAEKNYFEANTVVIANQKSSTMHPHAEDVAELCKMQYKQCETFDFPLLKDQYISIIHN